MNKVIGTQGTNNEAYDGICGQTISLHARRLGLNMRLVTFHGVIAIGHNVVWGDIWGC